MSMNLVKPIFSLSFTELFISYISWGGSRRRQHHQPHTTTIYHRIGLTLPLLLKLLLIDIGGQTDGRTDRQTGIRIRVIRRCGWLVSFERVHARTHTQAMHKSPSAVPFIFISTQVCTSLGPVFLRELHSYILYEFIVV